MPRPPKHAINFTKAAIGRLDPPKSGDLIVSDTRIPGLQLRVGKEGKVYYWYRSVAGRPERVRIGTIHDVSIEKARDAANGFNAQLGKGENPADRVRRHKGTMTFGELFEHWLAYAKQTKRTWDEDERIYKRHLEPWKHRKLHTIKKSDVAAVHTAIGKTAPIQANRVLALVTSLFNRAADDFGFDTANPAAGVRRFPERSRDRFLQPQELKPFFKALASEPNEGLRDYVLISLLTGARRANVLAMRWADIDLARGTWTIPADVSKNAMTLLVHLSPQALTVLKSRQKLTKKSPYVFPSHGQTGHLADPKAAWRRLLERAKITDLRIHDLRRTLGSWATMTGASLPIIGKALGHKSQQATQVYARLDMSPVARAVNTATVAMLEAGGVKSEAQE